MTGGREVKSLEASTLSELRDAIAEMEAQGWRKLGSISETRESTDGKQLGYTVLMERI